VEVQFFRNRNEGREVLQVVAQIDTGKISIDAENIISHRRDARLVLISIEKQRRSTA
jgi:hypothetical protein